MLTKKNNNLTVVKSNALVEASYRLNLNEKRLVMACIAQLDSRKPVPDEITVLAQDYAEAYGLSLKNAYTQLYDATNTLFDREIKIGMTEPYGDGERIRWVSHIKLADGSGQVKLRFSDAVKGYIGNLKARFTSFKFEQVSALKSVYSIRLYELFIQFQKFEQRKISLEDLKEMLGIEASQYQAFKALKQRVITPAMKELNAKTNLEVDYEQIKDGRKVVALEFFFREKEQLQLEV
jgi:plasmid replication initiation protein